MSIHPPFPIIDHDPGEPSVFLPGNLMEASRKKKGLEFRQVPTGCLLDFDGELVEYLMGVGRARAEPDWPCFHTRLYRWRGSGREYGIIGGTVGAPFAVLIAEELFAYGCQALVSIGSAGMLGKDYQPPFFLMIDRAVRDEGTSYHYLPPAPFIETDQELLKQVEERIMRAGIQVLRAGAWTTDAPFRETASRIASYRDQGVVAVEMEAAALLSFATAGGRKVMCFSHVTNEMATNTEDFDKGGQSGHETALRLCEVALESLLTMDAVG